MERYELTHETLIVDGHMLHRIKAVVDFRAIHAGELGGWLESENNLDQDSEAWVSGKARVSGKASVYGEAWVSGEARVSGKARVSGELGAV